MGLPTITDKVYFDLRIVGFRSGESGLCRCGKGHFCLPAHRGDVHRPPRRRGGDHTRLQRSAGLRPLREGRPLRRPAIPPVRLTPSFSSPLHPATAILQPHRPPLPGPQLAFASHSSPPLATLPLGMPTRAMGPPCPPTPTRPSSSASRVCWSRADASRTSRRSRSPASRSSSSRTDCCQVWALNAMESTRPSRLSALTFP